VCLQLAYLLLESFNGFRINILNGCFREPMIKLELMEEDYIPKIRGRPGSKSKSKKQRVVICGKCNEKTWDYKKVKGVKMCRKCGCGGYVKCVDCGEVNIEEKEMLPDNGVWMCGQCVDTDNESGPFKCVLCHDKFDKASSVVTHLTEFHEQRKPYSCSVCNKAFQRWHSLATHMKKHLGTLKFSCTSCDFMCDHKSTMELHKKRHLKEYTVKCATCDKGT